jgi:N-ethylmaleimide reductase
MTADLFTPITLGALTLPNRIVMPALTRSRAGADEVPTDLSARYYAQRASAGLIVAEGSQVSEVGRGFVGTPGIYSDAQGEGWQQVTDAVHAAGGRIFLQLWHVGRASHTDFQPGGAAPVAPSAIQAQAKAFTAEGFKDASMPQALTLEGIAGVVTEFHSAARRALEAGFDGVELHGATGYLPDQFLRDQSNRRVDAYGGSIENRARFLLEVVDAMIDVWGAGRVGVRVSPQNMYNDMADSDPQPLFEYVAAALSQRRVAYLSVVEGDMTGQNQQPFDYLALRRAFDGCYMANLMYDFERATAAVREGNVDLVAFGRGFIANPDLVERLRTGAPLNEPDPNTFYGGDAKGYVDYPTLAESVAA